MKRERSANQTARLGERFGYSIVKITRFYDYQTWPTHLRNSRGAQRFVGLFECAIRALIGWAEELQSQSSLVFLPRLWRDRAGHNPRRVLGTRHGGWRDSWRVHGARHRSEVDIPNRGCLLICHSCSLLWNQQYSPASGHVLQNPGRARTGD